MKCPCCNNEMRKGVVQSARKIFFTTKPHRLLFAPNPRKEVSLSAYNLIRPTCVAYMCRACKKVVIDYAEKPE